MIDPPDSEAPAPIPRGVPKTLPAKAPHPWQSGLRDLRTSAKALAGWQDQDCCDAGVPQGQFGALSPSTICQPEQPGATATAVPQGPNTDAQNTPVEFEISVLRFVPWPTPPKPGDPRRMLAGRIEVERVDRIVTDTARLRGAFTMVEKTFPRGERQS